MAVKTLVLGMGNPILGDDGIGIAAARALGDLLPGVDVAVCTTIGLDLMDLFSGYDSVIVVDAMCTRTGTPGEVRQIDPDSGPGTLHLFSSHGLHFFQVMDLGRRLGLEMPTSTRVFGIEIGDMVSFDEALSEGLRGDLGRIVQAIAKEVAGLPCTSTNGTPTKGEDDEPAPTDGQAISRENRRP